MKKNFRASKKKDYIIIAGEKIFVGPDTIPHTKGVTQQELMQVLNKYAGSGIFENQTAEKEINEQQSSRARSYP